MSSVVANPNADSALLEEGRGNIIPSAPLGQPLLSNTPSGVMSSGRNIQHINPQVIAAKESRANNFRFLGVIFIAAGIVTVIAGEAAKNSEAGIAGAVSVWVGVVLARKWIWYACQKCPEWFEPRGPDLIGVY